MKKNDQLVASPRTRARFGLAGVVATGALALGLSFGGLAVPLSYADEAAAPAEVSAAAQIDGDPTLAERIAAEVLPSVGSVYCLVDSGYQQGISQGSCEVLTADGYILTNYHVIEGASQIQVVLNGDAYDATVVGSDPSSDVSVLKVEPGETPLTPIKVGDSSQVRVGQWVMTLGTPYGESESVSVGIVSGLSRTSSLSLDSSQVYYVGMIQSDAMINSGSSGGAMVNSDGEFIGMTTLSSSQSGDWAGMSYAIPSNYAMNLANQIIATGTVEHPQLGVSVSSLMDAYYQGIYSMANDSSIMGAYVTSVSSGSGAAEAGVQPGDVITQLDGSEVYTADDLIIQVRSHAIGDTVTLTIVRDGAEQQLDVVLGSDTSDESTASSPYGIFGPAAPGYGFGGYGYGYGFNGAAMLDGQPVGAEEA